MNYCSFWFDSIGEKKRDEDGSLPVIMAGDEFPRFIAMPCPCEPPVQETPHVVIPMY
ncbi:hypothetical protein Hanom_Chr07g00646001 [Helianthus anomalus]